MNAFWMTAFAGLGAVVFHRVPRQWGKAKPFRSNAGALYSILLLLRASVVYPT
jgi:hypothetical protein